MPTCSPIINGKVSQRCSTTISNEKVEGVDKIVVGTYTANYKARAALEKPGYQRSSNPDAMLRQYYDIPEDRLQSLVTYEKHLVLAQ